MGKRVLDQMKEMDQAYVEIVKKDLGASVSYLLEMEQMFDRDTRRLLGLLRTHADSVLADRKNAAKFEELQLFARAFVRAFLAHVEGVTYLMREVVLWAHDRGEISLEPSEISMLSEGARDAGNSRRFNTVKENFRLAFEYFPRLFHSTYQPDKGTEGWSCFGLSIKARDAITHPKTKTQFQLSGDAIREAQVAAVWFNETLRALLFSCSDEAPKSDRLLQ